MKEENEIYKLGSEVRNYESLFEFLDSFNENYIKGKSILPFHINIIDELHADENAHSRLLLKFLSYMNDGKYPFTYSFLENNLRNFPIDKIKNPIFEYNKENIDGLIYEEGEYAVIIENKIHNAVDQDKQIERYVKTVLNKRFAKDDIYVVYLTRDGQKTIEDYSLTAYAKEILNYGKEESRFLELNYKFDILPWLKDYVLPNCTIKQDWLISALKQYIDHLEGLFDFREINKKVNMEIKQYLSEKLKLNDSPEQNHKIVNKKLSELNRLRDKIVDLEKETEDLCWRNWLQRLKNDFPKYELIDWQDKRLPKVGVILEKKGIKYGILIEKGGNNIYYGIGRHCSSDNKYTEISSLVKPVFESIGGFKENQWWYGWKYTSFENAYECLFSLIKNIETSVL